MDITNKDLAARMNLVEIDHRSLETNNPKKVTFIACPWTFYDVVEFRSQQLGLGYVGGYAKAQGHTIHKFIDPMVDGGHLIEKPIQTRYQQTKRFGHTDEWIVNQIPIDTDIIGINAPFTDSRLVLYPLVRAIKRTYPKIPVVIGGVLATTLPQEVLEQSGADMVVKGEGEIAFTRILNGIPPELIPGVVVKRSDGTIFEHPKRAEQLKSVDQIPEPGYDFRPMDQYVVWSPRGDKADRTLSIISSRGCPFTCEFCSIPEKGQQWRPFSPPRVLQEIENAISEWGVNHIEFEDDNFTLKEERATPVLERLAELRKKGVPLTCSFPNGIMIDKMSERLAHLLKAAGTDIAYLPVEAGDNQVLLAMDKPLALTHLEKTKRVAKWCVDAGLNISCFFIVAYPGGKVDTKTYGKDKLEPYKNFLIETEDGTFMKGEDEASFLRTIEYCKELRGIGVQNITPLIATPYPGTELYHVCERFGWLAHKDEPNVLTTVSYAAVTPDRVQIETPWCSQKRAFERWHQMLDMFPTVHNVRKEDDTGLLDTKVLRSRQLLDGE